MTKKTGGQIVCEGLLKQGVDTVFGIPGGAILPLYGSLSQYPDLKHILVRHEQGASHAADGYARITGKAGVCFATSIFLANVPSIPSIKRANPNHKKAPAASSLNTDMIAKNPITAPDPVTL